MAPKDLRPAAQTWLRQTVTHSGVTIAPADLRPAAQTGLRERPYTGVKAMSTPLALAVHSLGIFNVKFMLLFAYNVFNHLLVDG